MPISLSRMIQAGLPTMTFASMPQLVEEIAWEEQVGNSLVVREPVGVVGAITPWNYPLHQIAAKVAPALAAGCTVVLKPSEVAPLNAFVLAEICDEVGLPAGRLQPRHRARPGRRRGDRRAPRDRHGLLHRLDARGPARVRAGGPGGQARRARARRQVAQRDPRRRRPRAGRGRRRGQVLPELGPDLQRADADARAARAARGGRADRRRGRRRGVHAGRPVRRRQRARAARLRDAARARARLHREGAGRGRQARHRRRRAARGPRERLLRAADGLLRRHARDDDRPGGDLRPGAGDHALRRRGGRGPDRQRLDLRPGRRRLVGRRGARQARGAPDPHRARSRSTAAPSTRWRRSAATSSPATAASWAATGSRSSSRSSRCSSRAPASTRWRLGRDPDLRLYSIHDFRRTPALPGAAPGGGLRGPPFFE